jgi:hypothetical protein
MVTINENIGNERLFLCFCSFEIKSKYYSHLNKLIEIKEKYLDIKIIVGEQLIFRRY